MGMVMSETESELLWAHLVVILRTVKIGRIPDRERLGGFPVVMGSGRGIGIHMGNARIKEKFPFPASLHPLPPEMGEKFLEAVPTLPWFQQKFWASGASLDFLRSGMNLEPP